MPSTMGLWTIRTLAGTGEPAYGGDGGPACLASLNEPKGVGVDAIGNILIADSENHVVRRIDRDTGEISTIAGVADMEETERDAGLGAEIRCLAEEDPFAEERAAFPNYRQQTDISGTIRYVMARAAAPDRFGGDGGPAVRARLNFPTAVVADARGNVYIADTFNHRIRLVDAANGSITTIAGLGRPRYGGDGGPAASAGLNEPAALALDGRGVLYVADQGNHRVRAIDLKTGLIRTVAGNGTALYNGDRKPATEAALAGPSGLACADDGTLFIADTFNGRIRAVDPTTGLIRTVAGDGCEYRYESEQEAPSVSLSRPVGIAVDGDGNLFITDSDNHLVRRWSRATGTIERTAGVGTPAYSGDGGPSLQAGLNYPFGIAVDREGRVMVADTFNHRIRVLTR
ncbi:MAG: PQQ-binding-like beta-propeller repeat protein [Nitrospira sp.]|nr:PQQ-binding-like beta-propeller repeat protein [Nitrospira sp.]MCP9442759.1 PQQ-binding-like beta-propeller repeat protein [Nitrospira sp.]